MPPLNRIAPSEIESDTLAAEIATMTLPQHETEAHAHTGRAQHHASCLERLRVMKQQEKTRYQRPSKLKPVSKFASSQVWRERIVSWFSVVSKAFSLNPSVVAASAYFLERAIDSGDLIQNARDYQLVSLSAFALAVKIFDSRLLPTSELIKLGHEKFSVQECHQVESKLMQLLEWRLNVPTASCFLEQFLYMLPTAPSSDLENDEEGPLHAHIRSSCERLVEIATIKDDFIGIPSSVIAYASILNVLEGFHYDVSLSQGLTALNVQKSIGVHSNSGELLRAIALLAPFMDDDEDLPVNCTARTTTSRSSSSSPSPASDGVTSKSIDHMVQSPRQVATTTSRTHSSDSHRRSPSS